MSLHKIALLILVAACARPAYSGTAPAPASSPAPAVAPSAGALPPTTATIRPSAGQSLPRLSSLSSANRRATAPVLVIPAKEMTPETCDRIVEDLNIMSRIIEKSLRDAPEQSYGVSEVEAARDTAGPGDTDKPCFCRPTAPDHGSCASGGRPKAIYIGGYGAVFSLQADFPLVPPPEAPEPNKSTDKTDRVWTAAQRELVNPQAAFHTRTGVSQGMPYRAEAVENLRSTLIALLKHATNIRDLEPESWLTIVVQGPSTVADQSQDSSGNQLVSLIGAHPTGRTLLTLRAKKADIDQLAKGTLEETEFQKRMQITTY